MTLISDLPTPFHNHAQSLTEWEISVPSRIILGELKTHVRWRKILGSKLVRRVISTNTNSMCRPPSKPPDRQNSLNDKISRRVLPYINPKERPLPKPPTRIQDNA